MDVLPPGLSPAPALLFDERSRPDFRQVFGMLAERADEIATAVTRVRLTTVDLTSEELRGVAAFRVLVTELNALRLDSEARGLDGDPRRAVNVELLSEMLESRRMEVRSAPLGGWSPDFTVFGSAGVPFAVICGFHWFERPYPHRGPALTAVHLGDAARLAAKRHEEVWRAAHDVGPAVWSILARRRVVDRVAG